MLLKNLLELRAYSFSDAKVLQILEVETMLALPLILLTIVAVYASGHGVDTLWLAPFPFQYVVAAGLHASYALPAARPNRMLSWVSWWASWYLAGLGMASLGSAHSMMWATMLEAVCWLLAHPIAPNSLPDRLADWRRTEAQIAVQLRMSEGLFPWMSRCARQVVTGKAETAEGYEHLNLAARRADAESLLRARIGRVALPEQLRQSVLTNASRIAARAEASAAARAVEMEQLVLEAMANCADECSQLPDLSAAERGVLTKQCEQAFLELSHHC
ncbi:MAG TPA: hypothetical protein VK210_10330 [Terriglobia bacterium]|nr:hypothetical protein [Terriglobia bacterium]